MAEDSMNHGTTYTVLNRHGAVECSGATLEQAADAVMSYDGNVWEIRPTAKGGHDLWVSSVSRNSSAHDGLTKSVIFSLHSDRALAEVEIFREVIRNATWWDDCQVMTDANYAAMLAEIESEPE